MKASDLAGTREPLFSATAMRHGLFWGGGLGIILAHPLFASVGDELLPKLAAWGDPSTVIILYAALYCLLFFPVTFLWSVLVWRASWQSRAWKILTRIGACCVALMVCLTVAEFSPSVRNSISELRDDPQFGPRGVRLVAGNDSIEVYGFISRSVAAKFIEIIDAHPAIRVVTFDSLGGRVRAAERIADEIALRRLNTTVSSQCVSACGLAFLGGQKRTVGRSAKLGFHAALVRGEVTSLGTNALKDRFLAAGVSSTFVDRAFGQKAIWYPSLQELRTAGVITGVLSEGR